MDEADEAAQRFDAMYEGMPPWELGRPQRHVMALEAAGRIGKSVLDLGCGTGENALYLAARGHDVLGMDLSRRAVERARAKAHERGMKVEFRAGDALRSDVGRIVDTVLDVGLFHVFTDRDRARYVAAVRRVLRPGGVLHLFCFSELEPEGWGPRRVTEAELRETFADGWEIEELRRVVFELNVHGGAQGWQLAARRLA